MEEEGPNQHITKKSFMFLLQILLILHHRYLVLTKIRLLLERKKNLY